ncbi:MAG: hypothetical protein HY040_10910 [Planctomycetes bacterium]|nr:hypothetical protein [Planctomycetota bacterium]
MNRLFFSLFLGFLFAGSVFKVGGSEWRWTVTANHTSGGSGSGGGREGVFTTSVFLFDRATIIAGNFDSITGNDIFP